MDYLASVRIALSRRTARAGLEAPSDINETGNMKQNELTAKVVYQRL
jgi:hypothetical protein